MYRRTLAFALALSAILGVGLAQAQSSPPVAAAAAPAAQAAPAVPTESSPPVAAAAAPAAQAAPAVPTESSPPVAAAAAPAAQAAPAVVKPPAVYYEKARIVVDGQAQANGSLEMTFTAQGGEAKSIRVNVLNKTEKNDVARDIYKELSIAAGSAYKVKLDGQKVHISKVDAKATPNYSISFSSMELSGVSVRVEKD